MKCYKKSVLLMAIGIALFLQACAGFASTNIDDPLEQLKLRTETTALKLSEAILQSRTEDAEQIEKDLTEKGWSVIIMQEDSPSYLSHPESVYSFWNNVEAGKNSDLQYVSVHKTGGISLVVLHYENGTGTYLSVNAEWSDGSLPAISSWEAHTVQDWDLSEHGNFYFRIRPAGDKHYIDYCLLRLIPPDSEMTALTNQYITPIGY